MKGKTTSRENKVQLRRSYHAILPTIHEKRERCAPKLKLFPPPWLNKMKMNAKSMRYKLPIATDFFWKHAWIYKFHTYLSSIPAQPLSMPE